MKSKILFCLSLAFFSNAINAQSFQMIRERSSQTSTKVQPVNQEVVLLNMSDIKIYIESRTKQAPNQVIPLTIEGPDIQWNLELIPTQMMSPTMIMHLGNKILLPSDLDLKDIKTFKGRVSNDPNAEVALTLSDGYCSLYYISANAQYTIEPFWLNEKKSNKNLYSIKKEMIALGEENKNKLSKRSDPACVEIELAIASDYQTVINMDGYKNTVTRITSLFNLAQTRVDDDFDEAINLVLSEIYIPSDAKHDPWLKDSTKNMVYQTLINWAGSGGFTSDYNAGLVLSSDPHDEGIQFHPFQALFCSHLKYGIIWNPNSIVHQIGHLLGAKDESDNLNCIMRSIYCGDGLLPWSVASTKDINNRLPTLSCLEECVIEPAIANFSIEKTFYCLPNVVVHFKNLSKGQRDNYYWKFPGGTPETSTDMNPIIEYKTAGKFPVSLYTSNRLGFDEMIKEDFIIVDEIPKPDFQIQQQDLEVSFNNLSTNEDHTYLWKFGDGSTSKEMSPIHKYKKDGEYLVSLQEKSFCGTKEIKQKVIISTVNFATDIIKGCSPLTIKFKNLSSPSDSIFNWSFPGGEPSSSTEENPVIVYKNYGQYNVSLKASNGVDAVSLTKKSLIEVDSFPTANFTVDLQGMSLNMINNSKYALSYTWDFGDGSQSDIANPNHVYTRGATFPIKLLSHNECGDVSQIQNIKVGPLKALFEANQKIGCTPFTVQYHNSSWNSNNVKWTFEGGVPSTSTDENPIIIYDKSGTYKVNLEASDGITTQNITEDKFITVADHIQIGFTETVSKLKVFFFNSTSNADTYRWDFGDGKKSSQKEPSHTYLQEGSYKVKLEVQNACESKIFEKVIEVRLVPRVDFTTANQESCVGNPVSFLDHSSTDVLSWEWLFEGGQPKSSNLQNPTIVYPKPGNYSVKLSVKNSNGTNEITKSNYINVLSPVLCPTKPKGPKKEGSDQYAKLESRTIYKDMQILPNPNTGMFRLDGIPDAEVTSQISILNLCGQQIVKQDIPTHVKTFDVDLMNIKSGVYQLIFTNNSTKQILKFVVQR